MITQQEVTTFWMEPTDRVALSLRRYASGSTCTQSGLGYHNARNWIGEGDAVFRESHGRKSLDGDIEPPRGLPDWPTRCACGYEFTDDDSWQGWQDLIYIRIDTGERRVLRAKDEDIPSIPAAEPGASWNAWWMPSSRTSPDGIYLMVRLPDGHDWAVDSQASNCTRPGEPHQCWVRHGKPTLANVTVGKDGDTCSAGAGSIASPDWHGFLRDGRLVLS